MQDKLVVRVKTAREENDHIQNFDYGEPPGPPRVLDRLAAWQA